MFGALAKEEAHELVMDAHVITANPMAKVLAKKLGTENIAD